MAVRLSPKVLLIDPVRMLPSLLLPLGGVLVAGGFSPRSFVFAAMGVAGSIVFAVIRWATFTYTIVGDRLELTRAFVSRSVRTIPLERIRGVDVSTPPLHRLLGLAVLKLDTGAGGDKQEGELNGVTVEEAERLRAVLLARRAIPAVVSSESSTNATDTTTGTTRAASDHGKEHYYIRVPRSWLRYGPLSGAYLLTPFALVAGAIGLLFQWGDEFGISGKDAWAVGEWLWDRPQYLIVAVAVLVLAMPFVGGVMYAIFNWDFTLKSRDGYLVAERGLINRRAVSLERRRIRGYELAESPPERAAKLVRVWAVVTGLGDSQTRGQLLPVAPKSAALTIAAEAIGPFDPSSATTPRSQVSTPDQTGQFHPSDQFGQLHPSEHEASSGQVPSGQVPSGQADSADQASPTGMPLRPHPPQARRRRLFRAIFPWLVVAAVAGVLGWGVVVVTALVLALLGIPLGLDRYRSLGHAYDGARFSVRSGSLRRTQAIVERRAIVGWTFKQTWFQRSSRLLTVIAGVGAGKGGYSALDTGERQGVEFAAEVTPEWLNQFIARP
ncbi:PH domain-containing protein [Acrocarpospora sp. B8E8]|uniref:PH domain-containing protein n=1 Tax=Acrocarpospora sp. B8E8 TaxID=3153572 RepID=UPI00325D640C